MSEYGFLSGQAVIQTLKKKKVSEYVMQLTEEIEEYLFTMIPKVKVWSYSIWALLIENPNYYTAQISSAKNKLFLKHRYCPLCSRVSWQTPSRLRRHLCAAESYDPRIRRRRPELSASCTLILKLQLVRDLGALCMLICTDVVLERCAINNGYSVTICQWLGPACGAVGCNTRSENVPHTSFRS